MTGYREASRHYSLGCRDGFLLGRRAIRRFREELGHQCGSDDPTLSPCPREGNLVLEVIVEAGLERGRSGIKVHVTCEIPANVVHPTGFAQRFDRFSIEWNDVTQLTLGVDRRSEELTGISDERDPKSVG